MKMYTWLKVTALAVAVLACSFASAIPVTITKPADTDGTLTVTYKDGETEKEVPTDGTFAGGAITITVTVKAAENAPAVTVTQTFDSPEAEMPTLERVAKEQKWVGSAYIYKDAKNVEIKAAFAKGIKVTVNSITDFEYKMAPADVSLIHPKTKILVDVTKVPMGKDVTLESSDAKTKVTEVMVNRVLEIQTDETDVTLTPKATDAKPKFKADIELNKKEAMLVFAAIPMILKADGTPAKYDTADEHMVDVPFQANIGTYYALLLFRKKDAEFVELSAKYKIQRAEEQKEGPYDLTAAVGKEKGFQYLLQNKQALAKFIPAKDKNGEIKFEYFILSATLDYEEEGGDPTPDPGAAVADNAFAGVSVYPNPFQGQLVVKEVAAAERVLLLNAQGMVVRNLPVNGASELVLDTENLPAGMYMVVVENAAARKVFKVVK